MPALPPVSSWKFTLLQQPPRFNFSNAYVFAGPDPVGDASRTAGKLSLFRWINGNPQPLELGKGTFEVRGASKDQMVGNATTRSSRKAMLWTIGSDGSLSAVDLHTKAYEYTLASGCNSGQQIGAGKPAGKGQPDRALLWSGTAASVKELWGPGKFGSWGRATFNDIHVGLYDPGENRTNRACLWRKGGEEFVDLHPTPGGASECTGTDGHEQTGYLFTGKGPRAALWTGSAQSFMDLTPPTWGCAQTLACAGGFQIGHVSESVHATRNHAACWAGNVSAFLDLHELVPKEWNDSNAFAIQVEGKRLRVVGAVSLESDGAKVSRQAALWEAEL